MSGDKQTVDIANDIALAAETVVAGHVRRRNQEKKIIAHEDGGGNDPTPFSTGIKEYPPGKHPRQADTAKNTGETEGTKFQAEESIIHQSESEQDEPSAEGIQEQVAPGRSRRQAFCTGEWECHPGDEQEQGEDGILMMQPVPGHVVHLLGQPTALPAGEQGTGGSYYRRNAHDKHHVKAPEDVNGKDTLVHSSNDV